MNTTPKQLEELDLATRFLAALGCAAIELEASDRPDVIVTLHGVRVGIEVTQFHADERLGSIGSPLRKAEVQLARKYPEAPHSMWGVPDLSQRSWHESQRKLKRHWGTMNHAITSCGY